MSEDAQARLTEIADGAALTTLINDPSRPTLVLFDVGWAGPGRRLRDRLLQLSGSPPVNLARVDVGRLPDLAQRFDVHGAPALVLFRSGQVAARRLGEISDDDLEHWLEGELAA
jgi:thioredoxin-like negative regulator of GroEL